VLGHDRDGSGLLVLEARNMPHKFDEGLGFATDRTRQVVMTVNGDQTPSL
jgi:hypothetical protein